MLEIGEKYNKSHYTSPILLRTKSNKKINKRIASKISFVIEKRLEGKMVHILGKGKRAIKSRSKTRVWGSQ